MKSLCKTLGTAAVLSALAGCGGSGGNTPDRQIRGAAATDQVVEPTLGGAIANDAGLGGFQSVSLKGTPGTSAAQDLSIANVMVDAGAHSVSYQFEVANNSSAAVDLNSLSVALEVAASGSFADSYRMPLYDIQKTGSEQNSGHLSLTARSAVADLPSGTYIARLVVNPNWQYAFDTVPATNDDSQPFRYLEERDYQNNASGSFQIQVASSTLCTEDEFEDNDSIGAAAMIPAGGQVSASLCLDDADFYSVILAEGERTALTFDYTDSRSNPNAATRYVVLDSNFNRVSQPTVARDSNSIVITASSAGQYYLAFYGQRASYRITRSNGPGFADDATNHKIFHMESMVGPDSWLYGGIQLHRMGLSEVLLSEQVVSCGRITTQFRDGQPVAYVTPQHFADIHEFRFLTGGGYLVDGERQNGWHVQDGDISNHDWYGNGYPGYAEKVGNTSWRYWNKDGLAYVECTLEVNQ